MSKQGFIKLHRQIQDHWLYEERRKFSKFEAWVDMLLMANHKGQRLVTFRDIDEVHGRAGNKNERRYIYMKVRHKLHVLMAQKEIKSIKELTRQLKKYDYATLYNFSVYVHKKLDPQLIYDLCKFFNCSIGDLLYLEQEKEGA